MRILSCINRNRLPDHNSTVLVILVIHILFATGSARAQSGEALLKAGYIEKFTHFVQWPDYLEDNVAVSFGIGIIGHDGLKVSLEEIFSKVRVNDKNVKIKHIESFEEIDNFNIVFICGSEKENLDEILRYTRGRQILTIGDTAGYAEEGVIINMYREGDYIRYEVNRKSLMESGLVINSLLLDYAKIIN